MKHKKMPSKETVALRREVGRRGGKPTPATVIMWVHPDMIISIEDALQMGYTVYRTGKPCKFGHTGWRRTKNTQCIDCVRERARKYPDDPRLAKSKTIFSDLNSNRI